MNRDISSLLFKKIKLNPQTCRGRVVIVTGAGGGIGFYTARAFALLGARVVLAELNDTGMAAEEQIRAEGGEAVFIRTDVSDEGSVKHMLEAAHARFGVVHTLINNAIYIRECAAVDMPLEIWEKTISVNLRGTFLTCQAVVPEMLSAGEGVIINMVSMDAMPGLSAYIASKQGICGFTQTLAVELHDSPISVIPFAPGMVDTPGIRSVADGLAPRLGLSKDDFLNLSLHSAYEGLMPVEHAAIATVLLATQWAGEYHGELVNGYEILEKAEIISNAAQPIPGAADLQSSMQPSFHDGLVQLMEILQETEKEFDQLPVFVRPMAKQGFKKKCGLSLADWQLLAEKISHNETQIPANWRDLLKKLSTYYQEVPAETARFTRDQAVLDEISQTCRQRMEAIQGLM
jgi:NAD(P)-dependent dehydrogenase (short-subunit alcohol dehydrogenase family)